jgi:hypothetical protein
MKKLAKLAFTVVTGVSILLNSSVSAQEKIFNKSRCESKKFNTVQITQKLKECQAVKLPNNFLVFSENDNSKSLIFAKVEKRNSQFSAYFWTVSDKEVLKVNPKARLMHQALLSSIWLESKEEQKPENSLVIKSKIDRKQFVDICSVPSYYLKSLTGQAKLFAPNDPTSICPVVYSKTSRREVGYFNPYRKVLETSTLEFPFDSNGGILRIMEVQKEDKFIQRKRLSETDLLNASIAQVFTENLRLFGKPTF